ncbi:MAG: T9SS type A sorting domain-containing protein [Candidatus Marinimicrobia bacterium]|nr:T9SS type A sorting domain-containing protein [Candidatus Neomarinimicrobiota bacterium]
MTNDTPVAGFQFDITNLTITGASGGSAESNGFMISTSGSTVIGFSLTGATIPAGSGVLVDVAFENMGDEACLANAVLSDANGNALDVDLNEGSCFGGIVLQCEDPSACNFMENGDCDYGTMCWDGSYECDIADCPGDDPVYSYNVYRDGSLLANGLENAGYVDGGLGYSESHCYTVTYTNNLDGSESDHSDEACATTNEMTDVYGCMDESACNFDPDATMNDGSCEFYDNCGTCDADPTNDCEQDCAGEWGGDAVEDDCGICDGDNSSCADCAGVPNGDSVLDNCGSCDADPTNDCEQDCAGEWGGDAVEDDCGVCNGGNVNQDECGVCFGPGPEQECWDESLECSETDCPDTPPNYPDWQDNPGGYEHTASMTAVVSLEGEQMGDAGDLLAGFDSDGNVRGLAVKLNIPEDFPSEYAGTILYEMQIRSNADGDNISFNYYDASDDMVYDIAEGYTFVINDIIGNAITPHELNITTTVDISIGMGAGWNWFSINAESDDMSLSNVLSNLASAEGDFIKNQSASAEYYDGFGWYGSLDNLNLTSMYKLDLANSGTLEFTGYPADPLITPINLIDGWNWIGYVPQNAGGIGEALNSIGDSGVFIKNQTASAEYYSDFGWYGSLDTMYPGDGFMFEVSGDSELIYPDFEDDGGLVRVFENKELPLKISDWVVNPHAYEFNGSITMSIDDNKGVEGDHIAVFVNGECRGIAEWRDFPFDDTDSGIYILMAYSDYEDGDMLTFKYFNSLENEIITYSESIEFISDMVIGDGFNSFGLSRKALPAPVEYSLSDAYPNPFNPTTSLSFSVPVESHISLKVYDMAGRLVRTLVDSNLKMGYHNLEWNGLDNSGHAVSSGMYIYSLRGEGVSITKKMVMMK